MAAYVHLAKQQIFPKVPGTESRLVASAARSLSRRLRYTSQRESEVEVVVGEGRLLTANVPITNCLNRGGFTPRGCGQFVDRINSKLLVANRSRWERM
jgi:hypothetical protein